MRTTIFVLFTLIAILLIVLGYKKKNNIFKISGYILLLPFLFMIVGFLYDLLTT